MTYISKFIKLYQEIFFDINESLKKQNLPEGKFQEVSLLPNGSDVNHYCWVGYLNRCCFDPYDSSSYQVRTRLIADRFFQKRHIKHPVTVLAGPRLYPALRTYHAWLFPQHLPPEFDYSAPQSVLPNSWSTLIATEKPAYKCSCISPKPLSSFAAAKSEPLAGAKSILPYSANSFLIRKPAKTAKKSSSQFG